MWDNARKSTLNFLNIKEDKLAKKLVLEDIPLIGVIVFLNLQLSDNLCQGYTLMLFLKKLGASSSSSSVFV